MTVASHQPFFSRVIVTDKRVKFGTTRHIEEIVAWVSDLDEIIWNILEVNNHIQEDDGKLVVFKGIIFHIVHPITQKYGTLGYKVSITNTTIEFLKVFTKAPRICSKHFSLLDYL